MQQVAVTCKSKTITWNRSMSCQDTRPAQPTQVECMCLCSLGSHLSFTMHSVQSRKWREEIFPLKHVSEGRPRKIAILIDNFYFVIAKLSYFKI